MERAAILDGALAAPQNLGRSELDDERWNVREARGRNLRCSGGELQHLLPCLRGITASAISGASVIGGRLFLMTALTEEASGIIVACARLVSGGGVNGAGAVSTAGSEAAAPGAGSTEASVVAASNAGSGLKGMPTFCGKLVQGGNDGERC